MNFSCEDSTRHKATKSKLFDTALNDKGKGKLYRILKGTLPNSRTMYDYYLGLAASVRTYIAKL